MNFTWFLVLPALFLSSCDFGGDYMIAINEKPAFILKQCDDRRGDNHLFLLRCKGVVMNPEMRAKDEP